jgi:hypothetical protein
MSNELTTNTPTFAIKTGTAKAPQHFMAPRIGVCLTNGKNGRDARAAEKASMPHQARNGGFHTFAGYLAATFPKAVMGYAARLAAQRASYEAMLTGEADEAVLRSIQARLEECDKASTPTNRAGFTVLVQSIRVWADQGATKPPKLTKAQLEALALVEEYVTLVAPKKPEADADASDE